MSFNNFETFNDQKLDRCRLPECDDPSNTNFNEEWVRDVLPGTVSASTGRFIAENCQMYNFTAQISDPLPLENNTCLAEWFEPEMRVRCSDWVFEKGERTIVNDVSRTIFKS